MASTADTSDGLPPPRDDLLPMIIGDRRPTMLALCGTPSAMMHWGVHLVRVILGATATGHEVVHGNYAAEFADLAGDATVICTSDCPETALCRGMLAGPVVVFAEDAADVIDDLHAVSGAGAVDALRLAVRSLCALQPLLAAPAVRVFGRSNLDDAMGGFVDGLLAALAIAATPEQRGEIDRRLAVEGIGDRVRDHLGHHFPAFAARFSELDPAGAVVPDAADIPPAAADLLTGNLPAIGTAGVKRIARTYDALVAGRAMREAQWPAAIFSSGDAIGEFVAGACEMIGPARIMIYGPYMHLPPGGWTARIEMEVADNRSGNRLKVDLVGGPRLLVSASADMPALGQYAFALDFAVVEPLDPIELRFQIESGAIEGRFLLHRVLMTRRPD